MHLHILKLRNIRSYISETIHFPKGIVLLSGDIGCGKSTILLAIEFALFGIRRNDLSGEALLRHGAREGDVELSFYLADIPVVIYRTLKRTKDGIKQEAGYISINNQRMDATPIELKAKILELLGYPSSLLTRNKDLLYRYTVFTPQEEMKAILEDDSETRLEIIRKIFGLDKYKRIQDNTETILRELRTKKRMLQVKLEAVHEKEEQKVRYEKQALLMSEEHTQLTDQYAHVHNESKESFLLFQQAERNWENCNKNKQKKEVLDSQIVSILEQIKEQGTISSLVVQKITELEPQRALLIQPKPQGIEKSQIQAKIEEITKSLNAQYVKKETLKAKLDHTIKQRETVMRLLDSKRVSPDEKNALVLKKSELETVVSKKSVLIPEKERITRELQEIELLYQKHMQLIGLSSTLKEKISAIDLCPTCEQEVNTEHKHRIISREDAKIEQERNTAEQFAKKRTDLQSQLQETIKACEDINQKETEYARTLSQYDSLTNREREYAEKNKEKELLESEEQSLTCELQRCQEINERSFQDQLNAYKELLKKCEYYDEQEQKRKLLEQMHATYTDQLQKSQEQKQKLQEKEELIKKEIATLMVEEENYVHMQELYTTLLKKKEEFQEKLKALEIQCSVKQKERETMLNFIAILQKELELLETTKKEIAVLNQWMHWFDTLFISLIKSIERQMLLRIYHEFNELFVRWFQMLMDDATIHARLDDAYSPLIIQNGYETSFEDLSGGEKTAVALAYRLALHRVINDVVSTIKTKELLILDEPTDGFSSEQLDKMRDILRQLSIAQLIIVSHETKIESYVDSILRVEKQDHISKVLV